MLTIHIEKDELWDPSSERFIPIPGGTFHFEHSLRSISKWEEIHEKPFLVPDHTAKELDDYFMCMAIESNFSRYQLTDEVRAKINSYIAHSHTATRIKSESQTGPGTIQTSETIYASMAMAGVPFECDKWNINRLLMTLKVIVQRSNPPKKMGRQEILRQNADLNRQRRAMFNSKG